MKLRFNVGLTYVLVLWMKGKLPYSKFGDAPYDVIYKAVEELESSKLNKINKTLALFHLLEKLFTIYKKL